MHVLKPEEMRELDRITIENLGVPQEVLMESAGRSVYSVLQSYADVFLPLANVTVVAGRGNNGGDGLVVARYLCEEVDYLRVYLLGDKSSLRGSALLNLQILEKMGVEVIELKEVTEEFKEDLYNSNYIVDAIFGTGFKGETEGLYKEAIECINASDAFVIAVDIPSGVNGATGEVKGEAVIADVTVTMAFPKVGHFLYPGKYYTGELIVADIGIPRSLAFGRVKREVIGDEDVLEILPIRMGHEHKGMVGKVLIIAGSTGFTGAATLTSLASMRMGAGLTYLAIPRSLNPILETKVTEVITIPVDEEDGTITEKAIDEIFEKFQDFDCVAIGPGLSRKECARRAVFRLLEKYQGPVVIDADAVWALKGNLDVLKDREVPAVLTPHPGELGHLLDMSPSEVNARRVDIAEEMAQKYKIVLVLKGAPTVVGTSEGYVWINSTGNPGLASGGTGDVLTGMVASLIAQGVQPHDAAIAGVYLHGLAGDIAAADLTEYSVMAGDLLDYIPEALNLLFEGFEGGDEEFE